MSDFIYRPVLLVCYPHQENFNISEGIDGSPMFYTVNYTVSGTYIMCATSTISTSSCTNGVCEHMLEIPSSICPPSSSITVIVSGTNRLGEGQASNPVSIPGWACMQTNACNNQCHACFDVSICRNSQPVCYLVI